MSKKTENPTLARTLAPEDIRPRMYVAVINEVSEYVPCFTVDDADYRDVRPHRFAFLPDSCPAPLVVVDVCLPFVRVEAPDRTAALLDVRRHPLARLDDRFARRAAKALRAGMKKRKAKKSS